MNKNIERFGIVLRKAKVPEDVVDQIMGVEYRRDEADEKQDTANFYATAVQKAEELLGFDKLSEVMYEKACCKGGLRLENAKQLAKEHGDKPLAVKIPLLGELKYMGKPTLNADGDIETIAVGAHGMPGMTCPCWNFQGRLPVDGPMPLNYCLCCAGHFKVHYQKALGLKLRTKEVKSSILNSAGKSPCVFLYEVVGT